MGNLPTLIKQYHPGHFGTAVLAQTLLNNWQEFMLQPNNHIFHTLPLALINIQQRTQQQQKKKPLQRYFYRFCLNSIFPSHFLVSLNDIPVLNFSEDASEQCNNCLREDTALCAFSGKCPLALELGAEPSTPDGAAFLLKPRRNSHSAGGLHSPTHLCLPIPSPLSSFTSALLSSEQHPRINFLVKKHLSLAFSLLQLPAVE